MLVITIRFLSGTYHATPWGMHVNEGVPEWPPSGWRLLRAMIAIWKNTLPELPDESVLPILQRLAGELPDYHLPDASVSHTRHYMPTNNNPALIVNTFVVMGDKPVDVMWKKTNLSSQELDTLQSILKNMHYFGRAESWCRASVCNTEQHKPPNCSPLESHDVHPASKELVRVLMPRKDVSFVDLAKPDPNSNVMKSLSVTTQQLQNKHYIDPPGGRWVQYTRPQNCFEEKTHPHSKFSLFSNVSLVRYAVVGSVRPHIKDTLRVGDTARNACMSKYGQRKTGETSHIFAGKDRNGKPLTNHMHAFYLPTYETQNKEIDHLTIYAPGKFNGDELQVLLTDLKYLYRYGTSRVGLVFQGCGTPDNFQDVSILKKATKWRSVTPLILSRHIKYRGSGSNRRIVDGPEDQIHDEIRKRYGEQYKLVNITINDGGRVGINSTQVRSIDFFRWRKHGSVGDSKTYDVTLEFQDEVSGPLVLGYASHFGLGMFAPVDDE